jgi:hypothetical protein
LTTVGLDQRSLRLARRCNERGTVVDGDRVLTLAECRRRQLRPIEGCTSSWRLVPFCYNARMRSQRDSAATKAIAEAMARAAAMSDQAGETMPLNIADAMQPFGVLMAGTAEALRRYGTLTEAEWRASSDPFRMLCYLRNNDASGPKLEQFATAFCLPPLLDEPLSEVLRIKDEAIRGRMADALRCLFGNPFRSLTVDPAWMAWNGGTVPKLAAMIEEEGNWADVPILADALEEAGCVEAAILDHCRQPSDHLSGCWVVEMFAPTDGNP